MRGKVDFTEILAFHTPTRSRFTLLATHEFGIIAAACFTLRTSDIFIDFLVRNDVFRPPNFVAGGSVLIEAIEGLAATLNLKALRLESVDARETMAWYEHRGFVADGPPLFHPGWGILYPLAKPIAPLGAP